MNQILEQTKALIAELGTAADEERLQRRHKIVSMDDLDENVPSSPRCYWIETTMPIGEFDQKKRRVHLPKESVGFRTQKADELYVVYSGTQANLRRRLQQHLFNVGNKKTVKLGLKVDKPPHNQYEWYVSYVVVEDPVIRYAIESWWRLKRGWPALCRR